VHGEKLPAPPEPLEIKERIKIFRSALGPGREGDNLAVWAGNMLARYLWRHWGEALKHEGVSWQMFMSLLKDATGDMVDWAVRGSLPWGALVRKIEESIERRRKSDLMRYLSSSSL
jgi:hypothetical protein